MHRIAFGKYESVDSILDVLNIQYTKNPLPGDYYVITFDMEQDDPRWPQVAELVRKKGAPDTVWTEFTAGEILQADWVRLVPSFHQGYPQPEDEMAWRDVVYKGTCPCCGVGYHQKAPFRLAREPRLGKNEFLCPFWTYTVFCKPQVIDVFEANQVRGYEVWPVILNSTGETSQRVSQLVFPVVSQPGLHSSDKQNPQKCRCCGVTKYAFHVRGYMRLARQALRPDVDFQLIAEWFGSETSWGYREILASNRIARSILAENWHGVELKPIKLF